MPDYRFTGLFKFPPDRGSPDGDTDTVKEEFEADNDTKAREWVKVFKSTHVDIVQARLEKIVVREKTERIRL